MRTEQVYKQCKNAKNVLVLEYIRLDIIMTVIYSYLNRENYKVLKFHMKGFSYFVVTASLF